MSESDESIIIITCPHCQQSVLIESIQCGIFRHGVWKQSGIQIPPHASKLDCDAWVPLIYGCGKPFRVVKTNTVYVATVCDYI